MTNLRFRSFLSVATIGLVGFLPLTLRAVTVSSPPFGVVSADIPAGLAGISLPLIAEEIFTGRISANSVSAVTFEAVAGSIGGRLAAGTSYYLEVVSGPLEGERFDIDTSATVTSANASVALNLAATSFSTTRALGANALAQARAVIRPHQTLAKVASAFSPSLVGNNNPLLADGIRLLTSKGIIFYHLHGDGQSWRELGKTVDVRSAVIPPDVSLLVELRSGAKRWTHTGLVRRNAFRKNLVKGLQSFATGFPIDMTPVQVGGFVDTELPADMRWSGSNNPLAADWFSVVDAKGTTFDAYSLRADGVTWSRPVSSTNFASSSVLKSPGLILVYRKNADPAYVIDPPFTP